MNRNRFLLSLIIVTILCVGCSKSSVQEIYDKETASENIQETTMQDMSNLNMVINQYEDVTSNIKICDFGETGTYSNKFSIKVENVSIGDNIADIYNLEEDTAIAESFCSFVEKYDGDMLFVDNDGYMQNDFFRLDLEAVFLKASITNLSSDTVTCALNNFQLVNLKQEDSRWKKEKIGMVGYLVFTKMQSFDKRHNWYAFAPNETLETVFMLLTEKEKITSLSYAAEIIADSPYGETRGRILTKEVEEGSPLQDVYLYAKFNGRNVVLDGECFMKLNIVDGEIQK